MEGVQNIAQSAYGIAKLEEKSQDALNAMKSLQLDIAKELTIRGMTVTNLMGATIHNPAYSEYEELVTRLNTEAEEAYQDAMDRATSDGGTESARSVMRDTFFRDLPTMSNAPPKNTTLREILEKGGKGASPSTINKIRIVYEVFVRDDRSSDEYRERIYNYIKDMASGNATKTDGSKAKPISYDKLGEVARDLKAIDESPDHSRISNDIGNILQQVVNDTYVFQIYMPRSERTAQASTRVPVGGDEASRLWLAEKIKGRQNPANDIKRQSELLNTIDSTIGHFARLNVVFVEGGRVEYNGSVSELPDYEEIARLAQVGAEFERSQSQQKEKVSELVDDLFKD